MKHTHYDLIIEWANDPTKIVQLRDKRSNTDWTDVSLPTWVPYFEYRIKPKTTTRYAKMRSCTDIAAQSELRLNNDNLKLTYDNYTDELISAEVLN